MTCPYALLTYATGHPGTDMKIGRDMAAMAKRNKEAPVAIVETIRRLVQSAPHDDQLYGFVMELIGN